MLLFFPKPFIGFKTAFLLLFMLIGVISIANATTPNKDMPPCGVPHVAGYVAWNGSVSTDWNDPCNWTPNFVPQSDNDADIRGTAPRFPVVTTGTITLLSLSVHVNAVLTINAGVTVRVYNMISIGGGTLNNAGTITVAPLSGAYNANALVFNTTPVAAAVNNSGVLNLYSSYRCIQTFNDLNVAFNNTATGTINLYGNAVGVYNHATNGVLAFVNDGTINYNDANYAFSLNNNGTLTNNGDIILNNGQGIAVAAGAQLTNTACATITTPLAVTASRLLNVGTITNGGYIQVNIDITNTGTITNNSVIKSNTYPTYTNNKVQVNNNATNTTIFTLGANASATAPAINGIFTNAAATASAGTYTYATNTFTPTGLPTGLQTLYAKLTPASGACSYIVPFTYTPPPTITTQPVVQNICTGTNATYTVAATDAASYQWQENTGASWANLTNTGIYGGTTTTTLTLTTPPVTYDTYRYRCIVTGAGGTATSNIVRLYVTAMATPTVDISITTGAITTCAGTSVTLTATPSPPSGVGGYQWKKNNVNISGETAVTYTGISGTDFQNNDQITCVMTSNRTCLTASSATSNTVMLNVNSINITAQPVDQSICAGGGITFSVTQTGASSFQWQERIIGGTFQNIVAGGTYSNPNQYYISLANVPVGMDAYRYRCVLDNADCPALNSTAALLTVNPILTTAVSIAITAGTVNTCTGNSVTFTATPTNGGASPTYQWQKNGVDIPSATNVTYTGVAGTDFINSNTIYCVMRSNATCPSATNVISNGIIMNVSPTITYTALTNRSICEAANTTVTLTQNNASTFQWQANTGSGWANITNNATYGGTIGITFSFTNTPVSFNNYQYRCALSNTGCGTSYTNAFTLTVTPTVTPSVAIAITSGTNLTCNSSNVTFTATPTPPSGVGGYQWIKNGVNISVGGTGATYTGVAGTDFTNTNRIMCMITSNAACASPTTATSAEITMTVNAVVTPSVTIALTSGALPACTGNSLAFTATPSPPSGVGGYQWRKNGANISGATNVTYTGVVGTDFVASDIIRCFITSNAPCASPATVLSTGITITTNPTLTPSVAIAITTGANPACTGNSITFMATPTNGGASPTYQWKKNGANISGATGITYIGVAGTDFVSTNTISCTMTSNAVCASPTTATSSVITMTVNTTVTPSVTIATSANPACSGSSLTFTATPTNGGATPTYQWKRNGANIAGATNATYTGVAGTDIANTDLITCSIVSNATCPSPTNVTSAAITMTVNATVTPSVAIAITTGANPTCTSNSLTFTATFTNGGAAPTYQWTKNGTNISGATNTTYTGVAGTDFINNDLVSCTITSNANCASPATATSLAITMTVNATVTPSVAIAITTGANPVCNGNSLTFTATPTNGGAAPTYQWKKNGANISGATNVTYTGVAGTAFVHNDVIRCTITSNAACASPTTATSAAITITVMPTVTPSVAIAITTGANPTCNGNSVTFTVTPSPPSGVGGYQWKKNGANISGATNATYTGVAGTDFVTGSQIACMIVSNAACANPTTATSTNIITVVNAVVTPTVTVAITSGTNPACSGNNVVFRATPTNGGAAPSYQWAKNGASISGATNATYTAIPATDFTNNDQITCTITSNAACTSPTTATSTAITMTIGTRTHYYVNATATGANNGTSWANAFTDMQSAINAPCVNEIWVAKGVYKTSPVTTNRMAYFKLNSNTTWFGGFPNTGNPTLTDRQPMLHKTILSGDVDNNDTNTDGNHIIENASEIIGSNTYRVVSTRTPACRDASDCPVVSNAIMDGFVVTAGTSEGRGNIDLITGSVTIKNCLVMGNGTNSTGSTIVCEHNFTLTMENTVVCNNANDAMKAFYLNTAINTTNCTVANNGGYACRQAGSYAATLSFKNTIFYNNTNGDIQIGDAAETLTNCLSNIWAGGGTGNITGNPLFVSTYNYELGACSPAIDAGTNTGVPTNDIIGNAIFNTIKDMGAHERLTEACPVYTNNTGCESITTNNVMGNTWFKFFNNNGIVAEINPNGQNLGNVTIEVGDENMPIAFNNYKFLSRAVNITSTVAPTADYTLRIFYKDTEIVDFNTANATNYAITDFNMAWKEGGTGCSLANYGGAANGLVANANIVNADYGLAAGASGNGFYYQFNLNHFTIFAATPAVGAPLPVKLLAFKGYTQNGDNNLNWITASEQNSSCFEVEESVSPNLSQGGEMSWNTVGRVQAAGNSHSMITYDFVDSKPSAGRHYYRLKMVDWDGSFDYSNTIVLENERDIYLTIYPNPTNDIVNIDTNAKNTAFKLYSITGVLLQQATETPTAINLANLPSGVYIINIGNWHRRIVKE